MMDMTNHGWQKSESMRLGDPLDPALEAASLALSGRREGPSSRFASIELRSESRASVERDLTSLAPLGYLASVVLALAAIATLWSL